MAEVCRGLQSFSPIYKKDKQYYYIDIISCSGDEVNEGGNFKNLTTPYLED